MTSTSLHKGSKIPPLPPTNMLTGDDDHGPHIHLHIESPPTWHFKHTQPFRNSGAEQRQECTELV